METTKRYYTEFHIAGVQYHDADLVWNQLRIGTQLHLVREADNRYDPNAVAITCRSTDSLATGQEVLLGYVPSSDNADIALLLDAGWDSIFDCRLSRINPEAHYEQQLHVKIRINNNPAANRG